jgi:hypothetical protein
MFRIFLHHFLHFNHPFTREFALFETIALEFPAPRQEDFREDDIRNYKFPGEVEGLLSETTM